VSWAALIVTFALVDNVVLSRLLGTVQPAGSPASLRAAVGLGAGTGILAACAALGAWAADSLFLDPLGISFLRTPVYVFLVAGLAWLLSEAVRTWSRASAGFSFPEAAINSAAIGAVLIIRRGGYSAAEGVIAGLAAGVGYGLVHLILSAIRQRLDVEKVPRAMRGLPLHLVSAGLLAYAFLAFDRAFLARALGG
jgi:Na+-translocating ferredoxin:NAD+ oxidoreductase subunit A